MARTKRLVSVVMWTTAAAAMIAGSGGCMKMYADPQFHSATFGSIKPSANPIPVRMDVAFQVNGKKGTKAQASMAKRRVAQVLATTRVLVEAPPDGSGHGDLRVVVNNVGNVGAAVGKGVMTGLTFGAVGSEVADRYVMTVTYRPPGGAEIKREYKHALHSTVGLKGAPKGMQEVSPAEGFDQVIEDMMLNFLRDLQSRPDVARGVRAEEVFSRALPAAGRG